MESLTLYKLMILYLLKAVRYPLTRSQLSNFMLEKNYCNYFSFQQAIDELLESHLMRDESVKNFVRFIITREGEETLTFFGDSIPDNIKKDMDAFLGENMIKLRDEVGLMSNYQENGSGEYEVNLEIREGRDAIMKLSLSVPSEDQAKIICGNWKDSDQKIYELVMKELLRDKEAD